MKKILFILSVILVCSCGGEDEGSNGVTNNNIPPNAPSLISPNNGSTIVTQIAEEDIYFQWNPSFDPDDDVTNYFIEIAYDANFDNYAASLNSSVTNKTVYLPPNQIYYWRVSAKDSNLNQSPYSQVWSFSIEEGEINNNLPPNPPILLLPDNNSTIVNSAGNEEVYFEWEDATDPDDDIEGYRIWIDSDSNFSNPFHHFTESTNTTTFLPPNQLYYWRVTTRDSNGNVSEYSDTWSFYLDDGLTLTEPVLIFPLNETECSNDNLTFEWNASSDPSGNTIEYNLHISTSSDFDSNVDIYTTSNTFYNLDLPQSTALYWKVEATNGTNNIFSETRSLYVQGAGATNTIPQIEYLYPEDGAVVSDQSPPLQWQGSDNETNNNNLSYKVYFSEVGQELILIEEDTGILSYEVSGLDFGTSYQWSIWVTDEDGATNVGEIYTFIVN